LRGAYQNNQKYTPLSLRPAQGGEAIPPLSIRLENYAKTSSVVIATRPRRGSNLPVKSKSMYHKKQYYVYIMTNKYNSVLYTGVTNSLTRRIYEHKDRDGFSNSFTKKYNINKLVYYEVFDSIEYAIMREKQLKGDSRNDKMNLVLKNNSDWDDLYNEVYL